MTLPPTAPAAPPDTAPDTKDWTWVLERPCPECGFDPADHRPAGFAATIGADAEAWARALAHPGAGRRPAPGVWSPVEYACHVRDVHRVMAERVRRMLADDDPVFANWDQDVTAVEERYDLAVAAEVAPQLAEAAAGAAELYRSVPLDAWSRPGRRSNGSVFTVETLGRYHLHDLLHHRWDVAWLDADVAGPVRPDAGHGR